MYSVVIEDAKNFSSYTVDKFVSYREAENHVKLKIIPYMNNFESVFIDYDEYDDEYAGKSWDLTPKVNDPWSRFGWNDNDPVDDYYRESEELRYLDQIFESPQSMVSHYFPKLCSYSVSVDAKNFWHMGVLRNLSGLPYKRDEKEMVS